MALQDSNFESSLFLRAINSNVDVPEAVAMLEHPWPHMEAAIAREFLARIKEPLEQYPRLSWEKCQKIVQLAKEAQVSPNELQELIRIAMETNQLELARGLIDLHGGRIPQLEVYADQAVREENVEKVILLVEKETDKAIDLLVKGSVQRNADLFFAKMQRVINPNLTKEQVEAFTAQAHAQGNLSLMRVLNPSSWKELALQQFKQNVLKEKEEQLYHYFFNSEIDDVKEFATMLREQNVIREIDFREILDFAKQGGALIARFPDPECQKEMHAAYGEGFEDYESQQIVYGIKRYQALSKVLEMVRKDRSMSLDSAYRLVNGGKPWRCYSMTTTAIGRYARFKKYMIEQTIAQGIQTTQGLSVEYGPKRPITFRTTDGTVTRLTQFLFHPFYGTFAFIHTHERVGKEGWFNQLGISEDWKELVSMKVDKQDPESRAAFKQKVSDFYWKGIQLSSIDRGNAQAMLELHRLLYELHDLDPPVPSRFAILPDCIALTSTLEEFRECYDTCWDFIDKERY